MYCGTSNIVLPVKNKSFYPPGYEGFSRLYYYSSLFNSLEVNQTFYKLPRYSTIARWAQETPGHFRFTMKLGKEITHAKGLLFSHDTVKRYCEVFDAVGAKKGCLLIQLPGGTRPDVFPRLQELLSLLNEYNNGWKLAVEFRNTSWYTDHVYELLIAQNALLVEHDMPASVTPADIPRGDTRFFRFHGILGDYRGSYEPGTLQEYAEKIKQAEAHGEKVYVYFNNTIGDAVHNAISLISLSGY